MNLQNALDLGGLLDGSGSLTPDLGSLLGGSESLAPGVGGLFSAPTALVSDLVGVLGEVTTIIPTLIVEVVDTTGALIPELQALGGSHAALAFGSEGPSGSLSADAGFHDSPGLLDNVLNDFAVLG